MRGDTAQFALKYGRKIVHRLVIARSPGNQQSSDISLRGVHHPKPTSLRFL
jgi:hypothetical protein